MSQMNTIIIATTAVVAGVLGAVSLYLFNNIQNTQHAHRDDRDEGNLRSQLLALQQELEVLREERKKNLQKNKQKRKQKRTEPSSVSVISESDFRSVIGTDHDSDSEEYYDFSTDFGDDDDVTLVEDIPISDERFAVSKTLSRVDDLMFSGSDNDVKNAYEMLIVLYNTKEKLSDKEYSEVLWRLCKYCQRTANTLKTTNDTSRRKDIIYEGIRYGEIAISINDDDYNCHKWYAILVGMRSEFLGISEKVKDGQIFYKHTNKALEINPKDGSLYHLRGRFVFEIASLSWFERKAASALFGELPNLTFDDAIDDFMKAEELYETSWKENKLSLAECYIAKRLYKEGLKWLNECKSIPNRTSDDEVVSIKVEELLNKYSSYGD